MTVRLDALRFAGAGEAAGLAAFLGRLVRWDRAAAVRLQARAGVLAVFGQPATFGVLAVRTIRLASDPAVGSGGSGDSGGSADSGGEPPAEVDVTVSAGELLEGVEERAASVQVPRAVTGPPWAGVLPPRGGWRRVLELPWLEVRATATEVIAEFRERSEALPADHRTRARLDALAEEIWSRPLGETALPLRAVHAAQALGFLHRVPGGAPPTSDPAAHGSTDTGTGTHTGDDGNTGTSTGTGTHTNPGTGTATDSGTSGGGGPSAEREEEPLVLLASGPWLRLRTPFGSVAVRRQSTTPGLSVTPLR